MSEWRFPSEDDFPVEDTVIETSSPGGLRQTLIYSKGLWWFPDKSMYVYYVPQAWRYVEVSSK